MRVEFTLLIGVSMLAICAPAAAQTQVPPAAPVPDTAAPDTAAPDPGAPGPVADAQADSTGIDPAAAGTTDIIVTARRQSESLQTVPQTITAVSGETIGKLNLTQSQDIASVVPGLTLNQGSLTSGRSPAPALRGVSYDSGVAPSPTVDIYINEVPTAATSALTAIYDIGNVQVLRGPQGTQRGRTAPSGAILFSTRRASASTWGGYASMLGTDKGSINGQGALNMPLVDGVLGVRVAGLVDQNDFDFVNSVNSGVDPYRNTVSGRASVTFTPTSTISADVVYQYLKQDSRQWSQVEGTGAAGGVAALAPAGFNGPAIRGRDRLAVADFARDSGNRSHQVTANVSWDVLGQQLSYVGGYLNDSGYQAGDLDYGNQVLGTRFASSIDSKSTTWTHELRLSSVGNNNFFNYSAGFFHSLSDSGSSGTQPASALAGTFGNPRAPDPRVFNPAYVLPTLIAVGGQNEENSFYGNVRLKLTDRLEVSGGLRYIINRIDQRTQVFLGAGTIAAAVPVPCNLAGLPASPFPGFCNVAIAPAATPVLNAVRAGTDRPTVYNASASYRVSDDVLVYATTGSSWRRGGINTGIVNVAQDPVLNSFSFTPNETSTSYEVGLKTTFLDRRLRFNLAGFYQKYKNFIFQVLSVPYVSTDGRTSQVVNNGIVTGADAIVKGFDLDAAFQVTRNFSLGAAVSYADGKVDNDLVPCRDANFDGTPDAGSPTVAQFQAAGKFVAQCTSNQSVSRDPKWSASMQSEVSFPTSDSTDVYLRGLMNYYPENDRNSAGYVVPDYAIVNLYGGLRSSNGRWDLGIFARNLTNATVRLSRDPSLITSTFDATFGGSGYRFVRYTTPREVGMTLRYQFDKR